MRVCGGGLVVFRLTLKGKEGGGGGGLKRFGYLACAFRVETREVGR